MASCEGEAQKARRPVVLSINKLAKGSSHHRSRPIRNGPSNKNRRDPAFQTFPSTHRPYSALPPPPPPPSLLRFFESSPLWLVAAQPTRPIRIILRRFTEPPLSLHRFLFFPFSLFNPSTIQRIPPRPLARSFDTEPVFTNDFNVGEARNRKLPIYAIVTGRAGLFQGRCGFVPILFYGGGVLLCKSFRLEI